MNHELKAAGDAATESADFLASKLKYSQTDLDAAVAAAYEDAAKVAETYAQDTIDTDAVLEATCIARDIRARASEHANKHVSEHVAEGHEVIRAHAERIRTLLTEIDAEAVQGNHKLGTNSDAARKSLWEATIAETQHLVEGVKFQKPPGGVFTGKGDPSGIRLGPLHADTVSPDVSPKPENVDTSAGRVDADEDETDANVLLGEAIAARFKAEAERDAARREAEELRAEVERLNAFIAVINAIAKVPR